MSRLKLASLLWPDVVVWVLLLVFLGLNIGLAHVPLGIGNDFARFLIAGFMALLLAILLMHLRGASALIRLVAKAGVFWLAIFFTLTFADVLTRR